MVRDSLVGGHPNASTGKLRCEFGCDLSIPGQDGHVVGLGFEGVGEVEEPRISGECGIGEVLPDEENFLGGDGLCGDTEQCQ